MQNRKILFSHSEEETISIAKEFCTSLKIGDIVALIGQLGTGKTLFIRGICNYFQVEEIVTSPTFTIMNQYTGYIADKEFSIIHIDLYRIKNLGELVDLGFLEILSSPNSIILIEWAEKAEELIPKPFFRIYFENVEEYETHRIITIEKVE
ncbi:MAG: tRNA (adenosine(37)-N6)-threonylcarbamoyltransferase complex ATPase subunit type 1 TsaE [Ignavibacteria bacterium]|nr:tRNA (adenosine(37)-N6)-threonylcarbamoyltransferase complex ATPase subunit type 1 TsaE [Ignavibacteria bacterium]